MKQVNITQQFIKNIGSICGLFRKRDLCLTLKDMSKQVDIPVSTLNAFELGHSSSLRLLFTYFNVCETEREQRKFLLFIIEVFDIYRKRV